MKQWKQARCSIGEQHFRESIFSSKNSKEIPETGTGLLCLEMAGRSSDKGKSHRNKVREIEESCKAS
jgi:hypothetical protein